MLYYLPSSVFKLGEHLFFLHGGFPYWLILLLNFLIYISFFLTMFLFIFFLDTPFGDGTAVGQWFVGNVVYTVSTIATLQ